MSEADFEKVRTAIEYAPAEWHGGQGLWSVRPAGAALDRIEAQCAQLTQQVERYEAALRKIADHFDLGFDCECPASSRIARAALAQPQEASE